MDLSAISFPLMADDGRYLGMTTRDEQDWLRTFAGESYRGEGAFVELGCLFGSLTIPIAEGLREAERSRGLGRKVLESYDFFRWHGSMEPLIRNTALEGLLKEDDWFIEVFKANTAVVSDYVRAHWEDLGQTTWDGGPIEVLLLDCLKYDEITNNVIPTFFSSLIPGRSRVLHQDYFHFYEWWTHALTFEQRDLLVPELEIANSGMFVLQVAEDFVGYCERYDRARDFSQTPLEMIEEVYDWNFSIVSEVNHPNLWAAKVWALLCTGEQERARKLYVDSTRMFPEHWQFRMLKDYCDEQGIAVE